MTGRGSERTDVRRPIAVATATEQAQPYAVDICTGHHSFAADEPVRSGGRDTAANPTQLALGSLGACTAITLRMYAERKGWQIGPIQVRVQLIEENEQRRIERQIRVEGALEDEQRARLLEIAARTPVTRLFTEGTPISSELVGAET
jgi:putative redox protein